MFVVVVGFLSIYTICVPNKFVLICEGGVSIYDKILELLLQIPGLFVQFKEHL